MYWAMIKWICILTTHSFSDSACTPSQSVVGIVVARTAALCEIELYFARKFQLLSSSNVWYIVGRHQQFWLGSTYTGICKCGHCHVGDMSTRCLDKLNAGGDSDYWPVLTQVWQPVVPSITTDCHIVTFLDWTVCRNRSTPWFCKLKTLDIYLLSRNV